MRGVKFGFVLVLLIMVCLASLIPALSRPAVRAAAFMDGAGPQAGPPAYFVPDAAENVFYTQGGTWRAALDREGVALVLNETTVKIQFPGARPDAQLVGQERAATANYYIGNDPSRWRQGAPMYMQVAYRELYPGVTLVYQVREGRLKSEFVVQPGADLDQVRVSFHGIASLRVEADMVKIELDTGAVLTETLPCAYQVEAGRRAPVDIGFRLADDGAYGFAVRGGYNPQLPLIIDPVLFFSSYLGGSGNDEGWAVAIDRSGNTFVTGITYSMDFPLSPGKIHGGDKDIFVARFDAAGALVYTTVIGGSIGEEGNGIGVDDAGNAYVGGETFSPDFPVLNAWQPFFAGYEDAYVFKLDPEGRLVYSTLIGGSGPEEIDDLVVDSIGNVYVAGEVYSDDYPLLDPWQTAVYGPGDEDGFISIFDANGVLVYSTYVGAQGRDQIFRLAVGNDGYVYGAGMTSSPGFPVVNPAQAHYGGGWDDCLVFKFDPWHNQMFYATFLGGLDRDECIGIAIDEQGYAYVTGFTLSSNFPLVNPIQAQWGGYEDVIVAKLDPQGKLVYSTLIGGQGTERGWGLALDSGKNIYITGETNSADFPVVDALQPAFQGGKRDAFLLRLDSAGVLRYASFLGGSEYDHGWRVTVDQAWVVHVVGATSSPDWPLASPAQGRLAGGNDGFVARFGLVPTPTPTPTPTPAPTPTPFAQSVIGPRGGMVWLAYPGRLIALTVPPGAVGADTVFVITYAAFPDRQGSLRGMDEFFKLKAYQGAVEPGTFYLPLKLVVGFPKPAPPIVKDTVALYRLDGGAWTDDGIVISERADTFLAAWIDRMGTYGVLGQTHPIYLPLVLRR